MKGYNMINNDDNELYGEIYTDEPLDKETEAILQKEIAKGDEIFEKFKTRFNIPLMEKILKRSYDFCSPQKEQVLRERRERDNKLKNIT